MAKNLPHEVIIEILSRLPTKTLITFRYDSKPWCNLTYDTNFIKMHLTRVLERDDLNLFVTDTSLNHKELELKGVDDDGNEVESRLVFGYEFHTHLYCIDGTLFDKLVQLRNPLGMSFTNLFGPPFDDSKAMGTCNGIICLARRNIVLLLNPTTQEFKVLGFGEEFDFDYHQNNGFGYDGSSDDYMLVN
ncbi:hypothetical protein IFM89_001514 [Coptis chinensis]|uniref:F-box domain-containing protein n=1 Tax=Coptis chinensis TaxID=261450 RepID=A0A835LTQ3_9MAGN|nr:hypothetical protein IFM89_001514 [Coptis chinensis]